MANVTDSACIPMKRVGPVKITGPVVDAEVMIPLATFERPLWPSVGRGARVTREAGGIAVVITDERMTRSVLLEAPDAAAALAVGRALESKQDEMDTVVHHSSRYAKLLAWRPFYHANLLWLRFEFDTGDAAGHNMATRAADQLMEWLLTEFPKLSYVSISGNLCTDKKVSAVNSIMGRGRSAVAETRIPADLCLSQLKTSPEKIVQLHIRKNLIGSIMAGSLCSANAHAANVLLGIYLATGQDAANIVEGSQALTHAEVCDDDLYFAVTVPNLIMGTVGNGKELDFVQENLKALTCADDREPGDNGRRLCAITAAAVLCGELSLLAAQTNPGELMEAHMRLERQGTGGEGQEAGDI